MCVTLLSEIIKDHFLLVRFLKTCGAFLRRQGRRPFFLVRISEVSEVEGTIRPNTYHGHWNVDLFINFCSSEFFTSEMGIPPKKLLRDATVHIARSELPCLTFVLNVWTFQSVLTRTSAYEGTNGQGVSLRLIGSH